MRLTVRARSWSDLSLRAKALVVAAPALAAILLSTGSLMMVTSREQSAETQLTTALDQQRALTQFLSDDLDMEADVWRYAESGSASDLAAARRQSTPVAKDLAEIGTFIHHDRAQRAQFSRLIALVAADANIDQHIDATVALGNFQVPDNINHLLDLISKEGMTVIEIRTGVTQAMERQAASRTRAAQRSVAHLRTALDLTVIASVVVGFGGGLASVMLFTSGVGRRIRSLHRAAHHLQDGRPLDDLPTGADEIGALGRAFQTASEMLAEREARLEEAREVALNASNAKSDFLARMSHELRTPLNAIIGFGQILEVEDPTDDQRDSIEHILRAGTHLLSLINEVLDIARVESGHLELNIEPVDVHQLIREVIDLLRPLAAGRDVTLVRGTDDSPAMVNADHQRSRQVLINLVSNAIKYNRPGGTVTLAATSPVQEANSASTGEPDRAEPPAPAPAVRISVADTGIGIAAEHRAAIFAPFERLDAEDSDVEGSGVGLSLAKRLVEEMGGSIGFESVVGEGSTFWVEFPASSVPEPGPRGDPAGFSEPGPRGDPAGGTPAGVSPSPDTAAVPSNGRDRLDRARILYVENDRSNLALMERIMRHHPHLEMLSVTRGRSALEIAAHTPPDLVLMDTHLADMTGEELVLALRKDPATALTPIIVVSADAMETSIAKLAGAGATAYLTKPLDIGEFNDTLHAGLRGAL